MSTPNDFGNDSSLVQQGILISSFIKLFCDLFYICVFLWIISYPTLLKYCYFIGYVYVVAFEQNKEEIK